MSGFYGEAQRWTPLDFHKWHNGSYINFEVCNPLRERCFDYRA
jgi:hypothetical protein